MRKSLARPKDHAPTASGSSAGNPYYAIGKRIDGKGYDVLIREDGVWRQAGPYRLQRDATAAMRSGHAYHNSRLPTPDPIEAEAESAIGMEQPR